jgi:type IV pilus assembly protein PilM
MDLKQIFGFGNGGSGSLIGIDLSASAVKTLELSGTADAPQIEQSAIVALKEGAMVDNALVDFDAVVGALRRALDMHGKGKERLAFALPDSVVMMKSVVLAAMQSEREFEELVMMEAARFVPFSLDEVALDWQVLGPGHIEDTVETFIVAARRDRVDELVALADAVDAQPAVVDVASLAWQRAMFRNAEKERLNRIEAHCNLGANLLEVLIFHHGKRIFDRTQPVGGRQLEHELMRRSGKTAQEVEQMMRQRSWPIDLLSQVVTPFCDTLAQEIARALQYFFATQSSDHVDGVVLGGGLAALPMLPDAVRQRVAVPVEVADPWKGFHLHPRLRDRLQPVDAPRMIIATGLALRRFES